MRVTDNDWNWIQGLSFLLILTALVLSFLALGGLLTANHPDLQASGDSIFWSNVLFGACLAVAALLAVSALGLWQRRPWALLSSPAALGVAGLLLALVLGG